MPAVKFSPFGNSQTVNAVGAPASGWKIYTYQAGSSTPLASYTDNTGNVAQTNPIIINSLGFPSNGQIWLQAGVAYKMVLTDQNDVVQKTEDNIAGVNDTASSVSEWVTGPTPTYINATSFSVAGDQRQTFQVGRRLRFSVNAGTVYGTVATSVYNGSSLTTITIGGGEGPLDSGLSSVSYGFLAPQNTSIPSVPLNIFCVRGLVGQNNIATPLTKMDFAADGVVLYQPSTGGTVSRQNTGNITNDVTVAGPVANGRDQAAAFGAANWIHFYFIWNGSTLATISSLTSVSVGPTMPPGYTHWAYIGAVFYNGSSQLLSVHAKGCYFAYDNEQAALVSGTATTDTAIVVSSIIPPTTLTYSCNFRQSPTGSAGGFASVNSVFSVISASVLAQFPYQGYNGSVSSAQGLGFSASFGNIPNINQTLIYRNVNTTGTGSLVVTVTGYKMANGGE